MSDKAKKQGKKLSVPREMTEIEKSYQQNCLSAGQLQYQIRVYTEQLNQVNQQLLAINNEAAARKQLDEASKANLAVANV